MNKKKNIRNSGRKKHLKRKKKGLNFIISFIFIFVLVMAINFPQCSRKIEITTSDIDYYIDLADKDSRPYKQLNWKEIASIDAATNNNKYCNSSGNRMNVITQTFFDHNGNIKSYNTVLKDLNLTDNEKESAKEILNSLSNVSLREKYSGNDENKINFINSLKDPSIENYKRYGVLPSITMAQAILESRWGTSELSSKYHNYFGIKAESTYKGAKVSMKTNENYNDVITANFRAYNSLEESIYDLGAFLNNNKRYRENGFFSAGNYIGQATALQNAGYATVKDESGNEKYASMLIDIIRENNLMIYDTMI